MGLKYRELLAELYIDQTLVELAVALFFFALISAGADLGGARQHAIELGLIRAFPKEQEDETLIIISTFHRTDGVMDTNIHGELYRTIQAKLDELSVTNVRVEIEPTDIPATDRQTAETLGKRYDASIIIWGSDTGARIEVSFLNLKEPSFKAATVSINETQQTQLARPNAYTQFIINDLPAQVTFLALFAIGQSYIVQEQSQLAINIIESAIKLVSDFNF